MERHFNDSYYKDISNDFKKYYEQKDYSKVTVDHYVKQMERFMDYLLPKEFVIAMISCFLLSMRIYEH